MTATARAPWTPRTAPVFRDAEGRARPMFMADRMGDEDAPLPLNRFDAIMRAADLNALGFSWPAIELTMREYHGWYLSGSTWRSSVGKWAGRRYGTPRGVPFGG